MKALLQTWDFMRTLRLGMALWLIYAAVDSGPFLLGILGGLFALQALLNVGCCGAGSCSYTPRQSTQRDKSSQSHCNS
jgi:hypothetical protein